MAITVAGQTWVFLGGILVGAALGVCYDLFRVVRLAVPHPAALVAVEDLVFFCVCAAGTFLYLLGAGYGQLRGFILVGELVGFLLYHCTLGAVAIRVFGVVLAWLGRFLRLLRRLTWDPAARLLRWMGRLVAKVARIPGNYLKSRGKNSRIPLQMHRGVLYNLKEQPWKIGRKKNVQCRSGLRNEKRQKQKNEPGG